MKIIKISVLLFIFCSNITLGEISSFKISPKENTFNDLTVLVPYVQYGSKSNKLSTTEIIVSIWSKLPEFDLEKHSAFINIWDNDIFLNSCLVESVNIKDISKLLTKDIKTNSCNFNIKINSQIITNSWLSFIYKDTEIIVKFNDWVK